MDRILTAEPSLIDNELVIKSEPSIDSNNEYLSSLSVKSFKEKKDENKDQFFIARDSVHRIRSDDIIGTELPANILDTDSYDKNEDGSIIDSKSHTSDISRTDVSEKSFCKLDEGTECNKNNMMKLISENTEKFCSESAVDEHNSNSDVIITSNLCTNKNNGTDTAKPYVTFTDEDQTVNPIIKVEKETVSGDEIVNPMNEVEKETVEKETVSGDQIVKVEKETVSVIDEDSIDSTVKETVGIIQSEKDSTEESVRILNEKNDLAQLDETTNFTETNKTKSNDMISSEKGLAMENELEKSVEHSIIESNEVGISVGSNFVESSHTEGHKVSQTNEEILNCIANLKDEKNETSNEGTDGFIPTIIDIRGACTGDVSGTSTEKSASSVSLAVDVNAELASSAKRKLPELSNIKSNFEDDNIDEEKASVYKDSESVAIHTVDDENGMFSKDDCDLMSVEIHHSDSCFTSEIDIKEEKMSHTEDKKPEVFCMASPSKIPLSIPVKLESSIEKSNARFEPGVKMIRREILSTARNGKVIMVTADPEYDVLVSADRGRNIKDCLYSISGYTCHLCNKTFQEHELLNDHMILHRNNSLVNSRLKKAPKKKSKPFECVICNKCLSSLPSLHQHMMIHNNEKPYICTYCKKDFRHQSQFRSHVQKYHEAEEKKRKQEEEKKESTGKNSVRGVDFGKLVGPLFVKESLLHQKSKQSEIKTSTKSENVWYNKEAVTYQPTSKETRKKGSKHAYAVKRTNKITFEQPFFRKKDNTKENLTSSAKKMVGRSRTGPITRARTAAEVTTEDDIVPLKTFNNVENIVMNATRYIVKLDNLDPNLLKRRIKTPDISIDKSSVSGKRTAEKRRVVLIPSDPAKRLKLDQIENIIIDDASATSASSAKIPSGQSGANEPDSENDYPDPDDLSVFSNTEDEPPVTSETLTHNELLEVLDDDTPISSQEPEKRKLNVVVPQLNGNELAVFKKETEKKNDSGPSQNDREAIREVLENSSRTQSVVMVKLSLPIKRSQLEDEEEEEEVKSTTADLVVKKPNVEENSYLPKSDVNETSSEVQSNTNVTESETFDESDEDADGTLDAFDAAFQKVAQRRLLMIRNRAAQNDGKVESKYLLGPLFWRKALRRARLNAFEVYQATSTTDPEPVNDQSNIKKRLDERRTNDPAKLQARAEAKLGSILNKLKFMKNLSSMNLTGPLFWRKTLQLAGIRRPEDLFTLLSSEKLSLNDIQFVDTDIFPARHKNDKSDNSSSASDLNINSSNTDILALSNIQQDSNERTLKTQSEDKGRIKTFVDLIGDGEQKLVSNILHDVTSVRSPSDSKSKTVLEPVSSSNSNSSRNTQQISSKVMIPSTSCSTADSILYDSLTRPVRAHSSNVLISASPLIQPKSVAAKSSTVADTMLIDNSNEMNALEQSTFSIPIMGRELTLSGNRTDDPKKCDSKLSTRLTERYKMDVSRSGTSSNPDSRSSSLVAQTHPAVDGGNIILNMNGDLQLIAPPDPTKTTNVQDGANYVLVSDETGAMRLVKEHDLRLVESNVESDSSAPQYVVNIQGENYSNLELIADGSGEHLTYALQFDGENYSAVQFVQNDAEILDGKQLKTDEELNEESMCKSGTKFTAPETATDLNHIGKELSDFLNLDYGTLLKNDSTDQVSSGQIN